MASTAVYLVGGGRERRGMGNPKTLTASCFINIIVTFRPTKPLMAMFSHLHILEVDVSDVQHRSKNLLNGVLLLSREVQDVHGRGQLAKVVGIISAWDHRTTSLHSQNTM